MNDDRASKPYISRRDLFDRIWLKPMTTNAAELGTKTSMLAALAKRLGLPLPRAGHWMKKEVGKEPPTPEYPANPALDEGLHPVAVPQPRFAPHPAPTKRAKAKAVDAVAAVEAVEADWHETYAVEQAAPMTIDAEIGEHKKVAGTRSAIQKNRSSDRVPVGGRGKFRLLVAPALGERACAIIDRLIAAVEEKGWSLDSTEQGYAILADAEAVGFMIEEKLDRVPHVITAAELKEKAEYDRKCALADRGIGYRPWPPSIPEHNYVPNGELILKFDHDYDAGGTRRNFADGKRQRLEDLIPSMIDSLEKCSVAVKAKREVRAQWEREWAEQERRRQDRERRAHVEGYRIAFLQRQIERKREIDGLSALIDTWEQADAEDTNFTELLEFARLYRARLKEKIASPAIAERIRALKLMDDDVTIYVAKRID